MPIHDGSGDHSPYEEDGYETSRTSKSAKESFTRAVNKLLKRFASSPRTDDHDQHPLPSYRSSHPSQLPVFPPPPPMAYRTTTTYTQYVGGAVEHTEYTPMHMPYHPQGHFVHQERIPPPPTFTHDVSPYPAALYYHHPPQPPHNYAYAPPYQHHPTSNCGRPYACVGGTGGEGPVFPYPQMYSPLPPPPPAAAAAQWRHGHAPQPHRSSAFFTREERFPSIPSPRLDPPYYPREQASFCEETDGLNCYDFIRQSQPQHFQFQAQLPQETTVIIEEETEEDEETPLPSLLQPLPPIEDSKVTTTNTRISKLSQRLKKSEEETPVKSCLPLLPLPAADKSEEEEFRKVLLEHLTLLSDSSSLHLQEGHVSLRVLMSSYGESPVFKELLPRLASLLVGTIRSPQTQASREGIRSVKVFFTALGPLVDPFLLKLGELLFLKTTPAAKFIRDEAVAALEESVRRCSPARVVSCLFNSKYGGRHINTRIKKVAANLLLIFVGEVVGAEDTLNLYGKETLPLLIEWLDEPDSQLRDSAKKSLKILWSVQEAFQTCFKLHMDKDKARPARKKLNKLFGVDDSNSLRSFNFKFKPSHS